ncbi:branched-chain amino acid ABC transporter substrate-binding protein [Streptomyces sp. DH37]|uniref:branched-chain amino acid ABC transporter substrate-binding protein n=1 Tax=Streptomyces sp. DH37 TaxID=3040122 RepID=UPI002441A625|nr:branched-chain amino acid ABC transporter substrate-binding protein [Streptomyces sp. DH37]MDG9704996.1 branched-chain amino acid ABC transporter substrate-binding protein [Streptomyces sp. DH37]
MARRRISLLTVKRTATAAVVLAVLAGAFLFADHLLDERRSRCGEGVVRKGPSGECVGVSDGSYAFADHLRPVTELIGRENARAVESGEPYVSVAYMTAFTLNEDDSNSEESVRHELQGAYLAQWRHNRSSTPRIRLLIANAGSGSAHWEHTVGELVRRRDTDDRLVAVTGLGPSTDANLAALRRLSGNGLATVASTMTDTDIRGIRGFVRVTPTNRDEAWAAAGHLRREGVDTAVVVKDVADRNLYARTLSRDFNAEFAERGGEVVAEDKTFDSSIPGAWKNELWYISQQLCEYRPQVVYFAGRGQHLTHFLDALANRDCARWRFTVMTGDDTTNLTPRQLAEAADSGIRVLYTGLAHPDMWRDDPEGVSPETIWFFQEGGRKGGAERAGAADGKADGKAGGGGEDEAAEGEDGGKKRLDDLFPQDARGDGQAMMSHDAVLTAATGARMAVRFDNAATGETVGSMFRQMDGHQRVPGASGFLSFANDGNPRDKVLPVLELKPDGNPVFVEAVAPRR